MTETDRQMAEALAARVAAAGGTAYYVGGCVRDALRGVPCKDLDVEVHGVAPDTLRAILDGLGQRLELGASFGVWGLKGCGLDIAMPRRETATGRGHRDFDVAVEPFLGVRAAAERRDFTVNALMQNVLTGELVDSFGGREDLARGVLRHVSERSFAEDPLRVLRAAQFAARFGFRLAEETKALCRTISLDALSPERVLGELEKALCKAPRPSVFFETLRELGQLDVWFPEAVALLGVPQDSVHHPEGNVWAHTMAVLDAAAALRERAGDPFGLMLAALVHDFGKTLSTTEENGRIRSVGHERAGLPMTERFLRRLMSETRRIRYVLNMAELHMLPNQLAAQNAGKKATNRLFDRAAAPDDLLLLAEADWRGSPAHGPYDDTARFLRERLALYREVMARPGVTGADLLAAGLPPGREYAGLLAYAHRLRLSGLPREEALKQTLAYAKQTGGA